MWVILKIFEQHLLPNRYLDRGETWLEASEQHRDSELLKLFCSWKFLNHVCPWLLSQIEPEHVGGIGVTWRFRIAKFIPFQYLRWLPWWLAWKSWNDICSPRVVRIKLKLGWRHWGDMEIPNCKICSITTSEMAILIFFEQYCLQNQNANWAQT